MDKRMALRVLVEKSSILADEMKKALFGRLDALSEAEVDDLGIFLAQEQADRLADAVEGMKRIDEILLRLELIP